MENSKINTSSKLYLATIKKNIGKASFIPRKLST
jgi:hypothetical protein